MRNKTVKKENFTEEQIKELGDQILKFDDQFFVIDDIRNKTINGNCFDIIERLPNESLDLIIVDPPYNLDKNFGKMYFNKMNSDNYRDWTEQWVSLIFDKLKKNGTIYVCCDWESSNDIYEVLREYFYVKNRITWERSKGRGSNKNFKNNIEDIWFCTKNEDDYTFNIDDIKIKKNVIAPYKNSDGEAKDWIEDEETDSKSRYTHPSNIWTDLTIPFWSMSENTEHPTQKPEKLLAKLILASSNKGDIIFDPFLGSGTTSVVAKKLGRDYVGIEGDFDWCLVSEYRLNQATDDKSIQGYDGIFYDRNFKLKK